MEKLYTQYQSRGLIFYRINSKENPETIKQFLEKESLHFPVLLDKTGRVERLFGVWVHPTTYLINRQAMVCYRIMGVLDWIDLHSNEHHRSVAQREVKDEREILCTFSRLCFSCFPGCAGVTPITGEKPPIPLQKANLKAVLEENEGLEIVWEDAKDARDFYRGGVQQKAKAEKQFQEKAYPEAMKFYQSSNDFFTKLFQYMNEDYAEYTLYEGTDILFFPNLLMADNYLKMGMITRETGREGSAQRSWKRAQSFVHKSLQSERTEWGLSLEKEISSLLGPKKNLALMVREYRKKLII